ncbi:YopX family protein, partial [Enterococcus sp. HMSC072H05]|uniref:YopX family protein n=1 Tax=Enterococcus sp. HMSC072H05 TaxID=1715012 RepID=UPI0035628E54
SIIALCVDGNWRRKTMIPKFRAWWIQDEVMTHIDTLEFLQGGIRVSDGCWHEKFLGDEVILMQSTGLKDKNGVEIFEGDIVLFTIEDGFDYVYGKPGRINLSLQWGAGVRASSRGNYPLRKCREVRIIGNIYENPELLEVE